MRNLFMATVAAVALTFPATAGDNARITDTEIPIGTYTDMSGVTAVWGVNDVNAYRMAFDEANEAGGSMAAKSSTSSRTCSIKCRVLCKRPTSCSTSTTCSSWCRTLARR